MKKRAKQAIGGGGVTIAALMLMALAGVSDAKAVALTCVADNVRWSASSNRIYVSGSTTACTLSDLDRLEPWAHLAPVAGEDGVWLLGSNIVLQNGAKLNLLGTSAGGDVNELRLKSNNTGAADDIVYIRAEWGTIDIRNTKITSWDEVEGGPDTEFGKYKRSYIQVKSFLEGATPRESRMDIQDSEIGYLGYYGAEAYGLSWKVLGATADIFDKVNVLGNVQGSRIHHNFFGAYTYGAYGMKWQNNEIDNNIMYGLDPHDNSDDFIVEGNNVHHNGSHGIIASRYCDGFVIRNNVSHDNGGNGIILHRDSNGALVENNKLTGNGDAALSLFESHHNILRNNTATGNGRGIRISVGSSENLIENNTLTNNSSYGIFFYQGSDKPVQGDGRPKNNSLIGNVINGSGDSGLKLKEGDNNLIQNNTFVDGGKELVLVEARGNRLEGNTVSGNTNYGIRLMQNSSGNMVVGNTIERNGRGISLRDGSANNQIKSNIIRDNDQYIAYIENASDNLFEANVAEGNGYNYYYTKSKSDNVIKDTPTAAVKVGDFESSISLVDSGNHVLETKRRVPTVVALAQSLIKLTRYVTGGTIDVSQVDFVAVPTDSKVVVLLSNEYTPGEKLQWTATAEGTTGVEYKIGGFVTGNVYAVQKDGNLLRMVTASDAGEVHFSDEAQAGQETAYTVLDASELKPAPSPVPPSPPTF